MKPKDDKEKRKLSQLLEKILNVVDVDILGKHGETPLHQAILRQNIFVAKFLLEKGADCNVLNDSNAGPLFFAVANRDIESVKLLLLFGANPAIKSKRGSPLEVAVSTNSSSILQLLEEYKPNSLSTIGNSNPPPIPPRKRARAELKLMSKQVPLHQLLHQVTTEDIDLVDNFSDDDFEEIDITSVCFV